MFVPESKDILFWNVCSGIIHSDSEAPVTRERKPSRALCPAIWCGPDLA
jgi:hypothetical protein